MDLKSGYPFWTVKNGLPTAFPPLLDDQKCDVVIVGAGITGALTASALADAGLDVIVLDKRDVGWGSTSASTALLQYEIDTELVALAKTFGDDLAVSAYRACEAAIGQLGDIAAKAGRVGFKRMQSLYVASHFLHQARVRREGEFRQRHGFDLQILGRRQLRDHFGVEAPLALLTAVAAQVDPYRLTYAIFRNLQRRGVRIFDRSAVLDWKAHADRVSVRADRGCSIQCSYLILAGGYESQKYLRQKVASNHSSYALVSEPMKDGLGALNDTLLWESARPYLYLRSTSDHRLLIGGEDDKLDLPLKRDAALPRKTARLLAKVRKMLPALVLEPGFAWAGTFAETVDGLPFFGPHEQHGPRVHFAMAYGGNGIAFSQIGAEILRARIKGSTHPLRDFFSFARLR
jgi:glycine/D-amino acid oxidase-like deaminating enzyme